MINFKHSVITYQNKEEFEIITLILSYYDITIRDHYYRTKGPHPNACIPYLALYKSGNKKHGNQLGTFNERLAEGFKHYTLQDLLLL